MRSTYPLVKIRAATSDIARPMARIIPAMIAGVAAGSSTFQMSVVLRIPSEALCLRQSESRVKSPKTVVLIKSGSAMQASVNPPAKREKPSPRYWLKKALPNKPKTIEGTPERA